MLPAPMSDEEDWTDLGIRQFQVLQKKQGFRFSMDAVLLAHFIAPKAHSKILDLGTGSAVIPLLLVAREPQLRIDGIEVQPEMAQMAQRSIDYNQTSQIRIITGSFTKLPSSYHQQYDYVISNPPYFPLHQGKISPNPQIAMARHELTGPLEQWLQYSALFLKPRGHCCLIHRAERLTELLPLCLRYQLRPKRLRFVHPVCTEPAKLLLLEAIKGGQNQMQIEPPLVIYETNTEPPSYTAEVKQYYA